MHGISCVIIIAVLTLTEKPSNASTNVIVALYNRSLPVRMKRLSGRVRTTNYKNMMLALANAASESWQFLPFASATVCHRNADCIRLNPGQSRCLAVARSTRNIEAKEHSSNAQRKSGVAYLEVSWLTIYHWFAFLKECNLLHHTMPLCMNTMIGLIGNKHDKLNLCHAAWQLQISLQCLAKH